ncbi:2'-5' RNA ligase family protein [Micromonospora sp. NPDC050200]|uniref:2'-5' RNA ligase family protein n=1 Tax=Micromonospora sp. NPDC050200 TaxID=3155664 RepID=UPI00340EB36F
MAEIEHVERMRDHWWWRPGWQPGQHFYACHFSMSRHAELVRLVESYQASLAEFRTLDLIPAVWLHLTMQGIGFVDEVTDVELSELRDLVQRRLGALTPPTVTFHRPVVRPEAVYLPADPSEPIRSLRDVVRHAVAEVLGDDRVEQPARPPVEYRPHVSLAYSNAEQDAEPIAKALSEIHAEPVSLTLDHVDLLTFHRDRRMYEWTRAIPLSIGGGGSTRV